MRPGGKARRAQSGVPTVRVVHGGVQYREYLNEEQRSQTGCSAGRMQLEFHHGLLGIDRHDRPIDLRSSKCSNHRVRQIRI